MDERLLTEKLIGYETSHAEGIKLCAGFVKGWLDARDIEVRQIACRDLPVTLAEVGPAEAPTTLLLHGHLDVVPGRPEQFEPQLADDRLYGRGAYDMKGAVAAMLLAIADLRDQEQVRVRLGIVPDEESEEEVERGGELLVTEGFLGDFVITGEPTDLHVGVAAKGVVAMRLRIDGRSAHGATPWLGENAILRAIDVFRAIQSLPFASRSSELFDRPSINLGRILGGDALNKVPDTCFIDVDVRYLPEQDPDAILEEVAGIPGATVVSTFKRPPAHVDPESPFVQALCAATAPYHDGEVMSVGRDGASDAVSFLRVGRAGGRVRTGRRRPSRARGMGLGDLAGQLPARDRRLRPHAAGEARRRRRRGGRMRPDDETPDLPPAGEEPGDGEPTGGDHAGEHELPPPATWAGRKRAEGEGEATEPPSRPHPKSPPSPTRRGPRARSRTFAPATPRSSTRSSASSTRSSTTSTRMTSTRRARSSTTRTSRTTRTTRTSRTTRTRSTTTRASTRTTDSDEDEDSDEDDSDQDEDEKALVEAGAETGPHTVDTDEADTLALADREQAEEAALAGLKARTAEHEAKLETEAPAEATQAAEATPAPAEATPAPAEPAVTAAATDEGDGKIPRAKPVWARFLAASLVIISSMAAATAISALVFVADFAEGLGGIEGVSKRLDAVDGGEPQTILILGSDKRPTDDTGRSDTTILLRVNPDDDTISLLSIPRDLKVNIPNHGLDKFNAAYSYGGPPLTLKVVQQLTGLPVNHVVNINFTGFADAVNSIGCVFIDVDRQYYVPEGSAYSAIDPPIEAGYQKLCGLKALQYVRYRLEDNDLVRAARQQDFVREARQKIEPAKLVLDPSYRFELLDVFKEYTTSDENLKQPAEVLELMKTFLGARNAVLNEVHFPAELGESYVTANDEGLKQAIAEFLGDQGTPGALPGANEEPTAPPQEPELRRDGGGGGKEDKPQEKPKPDPEPEPDGPAMDDATGQSEPFANQISKVKTGDDEHLMVKFPIFYPTRLVPGSIISNDSRAFPIDGPQKYRGYKFVVTKPGSGTGLTTEFYGVSGTNWTDPPILENPSETREIDGHEFQLFYDGDRLRLVAFKTNQASYWVSNTLLQSLDEDEMLSIATSMRRFKG